MSEVTLFLSIVFAIAILGTLILIARWGDRVFRNKELNKLVAIGRSISVKQAIDEYEAGIGLPVRNKSSLPGSWWFLRKADILEGRDFYSNVRESGCVVLFADQSDCRAFETLAKNAEVLLDPFDTQ
jgi:hypothetical protein